MLFQSNVSRAIEIDTFRFIGGASKIMSVFSIQGEKRMQELGFDQVTTQVTLIETTKNTVYIAIPSLIISATCRAATSCYLPTGGA